MDRDDVTSASLAVVGVVASTVAKALVLGGRLMAAGLGTLENALRAGEVTSAVSSDSGPLRAGRRSGEDLTEADDDSSTGFASLSEPAFEPADGVTPPARPSRSAIRRLSAAAAARTAPGPRPAKRATAKSLPPNLRPVEPPEQAAPVKGAAGAADVAGDRPAGAKKAATKAAKKAPATKAPATRVPATKAPTTDAAKKAPAKKAATKKAAPAESGAKQPAPAESGAKQPAPAESPVGQPSATETAASAHTAPEGTPDGTPEGTPDA